MKIEGNLETAGIAKIQIEGGTAFPETPAVGRLFLLTGVVGVHDPGLYHWDGSAWVTGDVTSITAGTGLTGGGNQGDLTLSVDFSVVAERDWVLQNINLAWPSLIDVTTSVAALTIRQRGTGDVLTIEDQASDTTVVRVDQDGRVLIKDQAVTIGAIDGALQVHGDVTLAGWAGASGKSLVFGRSGAANASASRVAIGQGYNLGGVMWAGDDGTGFVVGASFNVATYGTPTTNSVPCRISFSTMATGETTLVERGRIDATGLTVFDGATIGGRTVGRLTTFDSNGVPSFRYDDNSVANVGIYQNLDGSGVLNGVYTKSVLAASDGQTAVAGAAYVQKETVWTASSSTWNSNMYFQVLTNGSPVEALRLLSTRAVSLGAPNGVAPIVTSSTTRVANLNVARSGTADALTTGRSLTTTGDASWSVTFDGSANVSSSLALAASGVVAGTYGSATTAYPITVDAKGRVTSVGAGVTITPAWSSITGKPTTLAGYGITDAQSSLGFTPVQQGTGTSQTSNTVKIGWSAGNTLRVQIDGTDYGSTWPISVSGNAATVSNGVYTTGSYADPSWLTSLAKSKVGLSLVENTALSTWAGSTNLVTLGAASATSLTAGSAANRSSTLSAGGGSVFRYDDNGNPNTIILQNLDVNSTTNHGNGITWQLGTNVSTTPIDAGRIKIIKEQQWTATASTQDSAMVFSVARDGTTFEAGRFTSTGQFQISVATGVAPFVLNSSTYIPNLNADLLDGYDSTAFALLSGAAFTGSVSVGGSLTVTGNLLVNGTTTTINSTTLAVDDPIITLGGDVPATIDDNKDRGVEIRWHNGTTAKTGFFGMDDSTGYFTFIPDATNTSEVFSGTPGDFQATNFRGALVGNASTSSALANARSLTATGDASWTVNFDGSANVSSALTLANTAVTPGTYNNSATTTNSFTVDSKGRITSVGGANTITPAWSSITGKPTTLAGYGITDGQASLGFTPVQQGTGTSQTSNTVKIGWSAGSVLRLQIDSTDFASTWPIGITGNAATVSNGVYTSGSYADPSWLTSLAKSKVGLSLVENTALSTWAGSTNVTTIGVATATSLTVQQTIKETVNKVSSSSGAQTISLTTGSIQKYVLTGNTTFTLPTGSSGLQFTLFIQQDATGGRTASWATSILWENGVAPTITSTANKTSIIAFVYVDGAWYGFLSGQNY